MTPEEKLKAYREGVNQMIEITEAEANRLVAIRNEILADHPYRLWQGDAQHYERRARQLRVMAMRLHAMQSRIEGA